MNEMINQKFIELCTIKDEFLKSRKLDSSAFLDYPSAEDKAEDKQEFQTALFQNTEDLKKVVMDFYVHCCEKNLLDDFVTFFVIYCNFYIFHGLSCFVTDTEETMFGLKKSDFCDCTESTLLPYLEQIYQGIKNQDDNYFKKAEKINATFTAAHLYLFARTANLYFWFLECADASICESLTKFMISSQHSEFAQEVIDKLQLHIKKFESKEKQMEASEFISHITAEITNFFIKCLEGQNTNDFISYLVKIKQRKYFIYFINIGNITIKEMRQKENFLNSNWALINKLEFIQYWVLNYLEEIPKEIFEDVLKFPSCKDFFITKYNDAMLNQYRWLSSDFRHIVLGDNSQPFNWYLPSVTFISATEQAFGYLQLKQSQFLDKQLKIIEEFDSIDELSNDSEIEQAKLFFKTLQDTGNAEKYLKESEAYFESIQNLLFPTTPDYLTMPVEQRIKSKILDERRSVLNLSRSVRFGNNQHLLQFFFQMDETLDKKNKELEQEQKRRENLITSFTHDQKHCVYPKIIHDVYKILLKNGDEENASKLYRAYNEAQYQNGSFDNLYSHYLKNSKKILEDFHLSLSTKRGKTIEYLLNESLNLVLLRFLMNDRETADAQTSEKLAQWLCIPELRKGYTKIWENEEDLTEWFSTHFYPLKIEGIEESVEWNKVRFLKNRTAYFIFSNIFVNLFHNALNYGKKSSTDGWLKMHFDSITENGNRFLTIECSNPMEPETAYEEGHGQGIANICERILNLNRYIYPDIDKNYALVTKQENAVFSVKLYFAEDLLIEKG